jgi:hypothetical protein
MINVPAGRALRLLMIAGILLGLSVLARAVAATPIVASSQVAAAESRLSSEIPFRDTILVYCDPGRDWPAGSFDRYLAYFDRDGAVKDRLFDGFLFLAIKAASGKNFWDGDAGAAEWDWWFERLFEDGRQLDALERDAAALGDRIDLSSSRRVIISIPRPPSSADDAEQARIVRDFVDRCVRRFAEKKYGHLALDGFYWFHEGVDGTNAELVNALGRDLRGRGLRFHWIPYDVGRENRAHLRRWREGGLGFDGVWLQPNFFWAERNAKYAAQDLDDTVSFAASVGSGVEIEFDHGALATGWKLGRYTHYLMSAGVYGYRAGPLMYYDGYRGYIVAGESGRPVERAVYEDLYWFTRGAYLPKPLTYAGRFRADGGADGPDGKPRIGLWIASGSSPARFLLVEPDPNKDYLVIVRTEGHDGGRLELRLGDRRLELEDTGTGRGAGQGRFRLPGEIIRSAWTPGTQLVLEMTWTGSRRITGAWARPDDFAFRYLKNGQPMETEMSAEVRGRSARLENAGGETAVGLRIAGSSAVPRVVRGRLVERPRPVGASTEEKTFWLTAEPDARGGLEFELGSNQDLLEMWVFPTGEALHLKPGSAGDTCAPLHAPGASLVPDGKWALAGEFGRNYRIGIAGAELLVSAPPVFKSRTLVLTLDAEAAVPIELLSRGVWTAVASAGPGRAVKVSIPLEPGEHRLRFAAPVSLHDVRLERR